MIKINMSSGKEYCFKHESIMDFLNKNIDDNKELPNKLVKVHDSLLINLSQIVSIEHDKYISDVDTIVP